MKFKFWLIFFLAACSAYAQDCDELSRRNISTIFPTSYAIDFGGIDESINCGDHNDFTFTTGSQQDVPFSVFIWMNRVTSANSHIIISKYSATPEYLLAIFGTTLRIMLIEAGNTYIGRTAPMSTTGSWIGIAMTYDGSESSSGIKLYSVTTTGIVTRIDNANLNNNSYQGMQNTNTTLRIGSAHQPQLFFEGKLAAPIIVNKEWSTTEIAELATVQNGDYRKVSFFSNIISAWYFPNGQNDYPIYIDYKSSHDGTMLNMEAGDILTETP